MVDVARARRLAVRIREIAADTLERQVKDPRLGMVTVTDARVTPDLREATVYYTVYGDGQARADTAAALASATGVVRAAVGRMTGVRFTPSIAFVADMVPDQAESLAELLAVVQEQDAALAAARAGATYAGDPDPYRRTDDGTSDDGAGARPGGEDAPDDREDRA
jgi:ribosome-binding factor A